MSVTLRLDDLRAMVARALVAAGTAPENARVVADALVAAEADGLSSHGLARLPAYADQVQSGKVDGRAVPEVSVPAPGAVRVDARDGFAFPAIARGLQRAAALAPEAGVVGVAVANSHHFGVAGHHVEAAARRGFIALVFGNSPAAIAPWGGAKAVFGTNPIAFACPRRDRAPLVIDLSLSEAARGKIMVAAQRGEPIPGDWALDAEGRPTTDARAALAGTMVPMGGAKGAALVLMVEILSAALTGSHFGYEASSFFTAEGPPPRVGQFFLLLDPKPFSAGSFDARLEALTQAILAQPGTRLPGERRLELRARAEAEGVVVPDALYEELTRRAGQHPAEV